MKKPPDTGGFSFFKAGFAAVRREDKQGGKPVFL